MGNNLIIIVLTILIIIGIVYLITIYNNNQKSASIIQTELTDEEQILLNSNINPDYCLDGIDIIYWINLDRSTDRYKQMQTVFSDNAFDNIDIERISAVDGRYSNQIYSKLNILNRQRTDNEYACMLSHLDTIYKFSQTNYKYALIMEDDITLEYKKYWKQTVRQVIDNAPADWEIIQLCYNTRANPLNFKLYQLNKNNMCVCAAAYLITNSAAKKLISKIYNDFKFHINPTVNHHADCYIFSMCKTYTYKFPYFTYSSADSLLHPVDLPDHIKSKQKVTNMYKTIMPNA